MEILNLQNTEMMTSREIAEFAKASHDNVLKNIRNIIAEGSVFKTTPLEREYVHPQNKQVYTELLLDFRSTMIVVAAYKSNVRAKIIDRWQELEKMKAPKAKTRLELARENVKLIEEIEEKDKLLALQAPAVAFVDKYVEAKSSKCLSDVAKILGKKPQAFIQLLAADGVLFKRGGSWVPAQSYLDDGKFTVKTGDASGYAYHQTRVEPKGIEWLARAYAQ